MRARPKWKHGRHEFVCGILAVAATLSVVSCALITVDCGGPYVRQSFAQATMRDSGDTLSVNGYTSTYEEWNRDLKYTYQLVIGIQATAPGMDSIPSALRPHVTGARLELATGDVLYHVVMADNTSQRYGPPVLAVIPLNDLDRSVFNNIRSLILAKKVSIVIETDSPAVQFPRTTLSVKSSSDWQKTSGCQ